MEQERFTVGELSKLTGVSKQAIRYYDKIGLLKPAFVDPANGYRFYGHFQIIHLNMIAKLSHIGCSLCEIGQYLGGEELAKVSGILKDRSDFLAQKIRELTHAREMLQLQIQTIEHGLSQDADTGSVVRQKQFSERTFYFRSAYSDADKKTVIELINGIMRDLYEQGKVLAGCPVICWQAREGKRLLKAGFFSEEPLGCKSVECQSIPGGTYAVATHRGDYEKTAETLDKLNEFVMRSGAAPIGDVFHLFVIDYALGRREEDLLTELQVHIG